MIIHIKSFHYSIDERKKKKLSAGAERSFMGEGTIEISVQFSALHVP